MPPHPNFTFRDRFDAEAASIALAAALKSIFEKTEMDVDRVRQLVGSACDEDHNLIARAMWYVQWMSGLYDAGGERE